MQKGLASEKKVSTNNGMKFLGEQLAKTFNFDSN